MSGFVSCQGRKNKAKIPTLLKKRRPTLPIFFSSKIKLSVLTENASKSENALFLQLKIAWQIDNTKARIHVTRGIFFETYRRRF